jgi:hypothetical protein
MDLNINKISQKIYAHFENKYPSLFPSLNISQNDIAKILTSKKSNLNNKNEINNIINIIDQKIKQKTYSNKPNNGYASIQTNNLQPKAPLPISNYTHDSKTKITQENYLNNFNPFLKKENYEKQDNNKYKEEEPNYENQFQQPSESFPLKEREKIAEMVQPEKIDKEFVLTIDSKDRDTDLYQKANSFVIHLSPSAETTTGFIDKGFNNIKAIELLDIILIDSSATAGASDNGNNFPYLLLEIEELGGNFEGTNNNITKSFAILKNYTTLGGFKYYDLCGQSSSNTIIKTYNPRISLSKLTINILKPDGTKFEFGGANDSLTSTVINLSFRVTVIQKNLSTRFLDKSTF